MKAFLYTLTVLALISIAMIFAPDWTEHRGYILIAMGGMRIEMTVVGAVIMVFAFIVLLLASKPLLLAPVKATSGVWSWLRNRQTKQQRDAFFAGVYSLAQGRLEDAQTQLNQVSADTFDGLPLLLAADMALQRGDRQNAAAYLEKLPAEALKQASVIDLKLKLLASAGQWQEIQQHLSTYKKQLGERYTFWANQAALGIMAEVASKEGGNALKQYWQRLPRSLRQQEGYQSAYVQQLIAQGMHQDAEQQLIAWQKKRPIPGLYKWFGKLCLARPHASMQVLEGWIKQTPDNADYYSLLGYLAAQAKDNALAINALRKAISIKQQPQDLLLLASIQEQQGDFQGALISLKKACF